MATLPLHGKDSVPLDPAQLDRLSGYVQSYFGRAQSLVVDETVVIQQIGSDHSPEGFARQLSYEVRMEWNPEGDGPHARVVRRLTKVGARAPKPDAKSECFDPVGVSPEPLSFLLPENRSDYAFTEAGSGRIGGRAVKLVDYRLLRSEPSEVIVKDEDKECVSISMPSRILGRVWMDAETAAVLRSDTWLAGMTDLPVPRALESRWRTRYLTIDRFDITTRYAAVHFADPDESWLLPASVETTSFARINGASRQRITKTYRNYRRFVTGARLVEN